MQKFRSGEIVLVKFPFANLEEVKRRPALVLLDSGDDDILVARITSQPRQTAFDMEISQWKQAGLLLPSIARLDKLASLEKKIVEKSLGILSSTDWMKVKEKILEMWTSLR